MSSQNIAKWLLGTFKELSGLAFERSSGNREQLIRELKDVQFTSPEERLVSFDDSKHPGTGDPHGGVVTKEKCRILDVETEHTSYS